MFKGIELYSHSKQRVAATRSWGFRRRKLASITHLVTKHTPEGVTITLKKQLYMSKASFNH